MPIKLLQFSSSMVLKQSVRINGLNITILNIFLSKKAKKKKECYKALTLKTPSKNPKLNTYL